MQLRHTKPAHVQKRRRWSSKPTCPTPRSPAGGHQVSLTGSGGISSSSNVLLSRCDTKPSLRPDEHIPHRPTDAAGGVAASAAKLLPLSPPLHHRGDMESNSPLACSRETNVPVRVSHDMLREAPSKSRIPSTGWSFANSPSNLRLSRHIQTPCPSNFPSFQSPE